MNAWIIIFISAAVGLQAAQSGELDLKQLGEAFHPKKNISIAWDATNQLPSKCTVFRVVGKQFPSNLVSSLMELSMFTEKDRVAPLGDGVFRDKDVRYYRSADQSKYLGFFPSQGWIIYRDAHAKSPPTETIEGVPTLEDALTRATAFFKRIGIDSSELAVNRDTGTPKYTHSALEQSSGRHPSKVVVARYLFFPRQVDGVSFSGLGIAGGIWIGFGNRGEICEFEMVSRNLQPLRSNKTANPEAIVEWIRKGRAVAQFEPDIGTLESVKILDAEVHYLEYRGNIRQKIIAPMLTLDGIANTGRTNLPIRLYAPVLDD